jgi:multicomponent K+:H+ antiporter subunit D
LLVLLAAPVLEYLAATVSQLHDLAAYRQTLQAGGGL